MITCEENLRKKCGFHCFVEKLFEKKMAIPVFRNWYPFLIYRVLYKIPLFYTNFVKSENIQKNFFWIFHYIVMISGLFRKNKFLRFLISAQFAKILIFLRKLDFFYIVLRILIGSRQRSVSFGDFKRL